jgi:hypothetical protein
MWIKLGDLKGWMMSVELDEQKHGTRHPGLETVNSESKITTRIETITTA